jgi:ABC-2 type transport system permease protein
MSIERTLAVTRRIVNQLRHDHRTLALMFGAPILILALLGYLLRSEENPTLTIAISNQDSGAGIVNAARLLTDRLKQDSGVVVKEVGDVREAVRNGTVDAALVFSPTFSADLLAHKPMAITIVLEGSNPSKTGSTVLQLQRALMQAVSSLSASVPGGGPSVPQVQINPDLLYGSLNLKPLDYFAPVLIGFFAFFLIFVITCVSFLRERTQGTMERLFASPITRAEVVVGYMMGFGLFAMIQALIIVLFTTLVLQVQYTGNLLWVFLATLILAIGAVNLGIFLSSFARTELQAVQFIPLVIAPSFLLSGLLFPVRDMPGWLQGVSAVLPLTYANNALTDIMIRGKGLLEVLPEFGVLLLFAALMVVIASLTLRREVA